MKVLTLKRLKVESNKVVSKIFCNTIIICVMCDVVLNDTIVFYTMLYIINAGHTNLENLQLLIDTTLIGFKLFVSFVESMPRIIVEISFRCGCCVDVSLLYIYNPIIVFRIIKLYTLTLVLVILFCLY